ncbi:glycosyltransferase [Salegentibacter sediminis]|uniref:glycosyltransferase n=1 Tax=Salegentibacter sediminis TaxID=1930251 RepID=UPI0009BF1E27|nr:glycosyltransferase [Salegentibacter sediminis]
MKNLNKTSKILFMSTFPPTTCGIATYTTDTMQSIQRKFGKSFECKELEIVKDQKPGFPYHFNPEEKQEYVRIAEEINRDPEVKLIHIQHEFGLFGGDYGTYLFDFLEKINKPVVMTFHTVLPNPNPELKSVVQKLAAFSKVIFVMTQESVKILREAYDIREEDLELIQHGTHMVAWKSPEEVKEKYGFKGRLVLSTFGLLGAGKSIETALYALPEIIKQHPDVLYLIIGKTHPGNIKNNRDDYRRFLKSLVNQLELSAHVKFYDSYLELKQLLELLQATDVYLFTSKDPNQAVSGTFSYAMSCACPIIATTNPHTREILNHELGILIKIGDHKQLSEAAIKLLSDKKLRKFMAVQAYTKTSSSVWDNIAIQHAKVYQDVLDKNEPLKFSRPKIKLDHLKRLSTELGMIQFSKINIPDRDSGYTLDDNARALIVMLMHYNIFRTSEDLDYIDLYLSFIERCQTGSGNFVNYIDEHNQVHIKNDYVNLEDSNARAIWALGQVVSEVHNLPPEYIKRAKSCLDKARSWIPGVLSPRSIAFTIKGLFLYLENFEDQEFKKAIEKLAENLISRYDLNREKDWEWFEEYLTYANSILPEAMLLAFLTTGKKVYKNTALESFEFLLSKMYKNGKFRVISNKGWHQKHTKPEIYGEQPIDVAYTIQALDIFYQHFKKPEYKIKMEKAFNWFLGDNHLNRIIYNPVTGGCGDGLEKENVNLNQGAESTICYLMARLIMESYPESSEYGSSHANALRTKKRRRVRKASRPEFR